MARTIYGTPLENIGDKGTTCQYPIIAIQGTWDREPRSWASPTSAFRQEGKLRGLRWAAGYRWSANLDGVFGKNHDWIFAGHELCSMMRGGRFSAVAWSHGGQVAAYAASFGAKFHTLVTVGTPVRGDMRKVWEAASPNIRRWVHLYSGVDIWQWLGDIGDGKFQLVPWRKMWAPAENIHCPGKKHGEMLDPAYWIERNFWRFFV